MMPHLIKCGHLGKEDTSSNTHNIIVYVYCYICSLVVDIMEDIGEILKKSSWMKFQQLSSLRLPPVHDYYKCNDINHEKFYKCQFVRRPNNATNISGGLCLVLTLIIKLIFDPGVRRDLWISDLVKEMFSNMCDLWKCIYCVVGFVWSWNWFVIGPGEGGVTSPSNLVSTHIAMSQISKPSSSFNQLLYCIF